MKKRKEIVLTKKYGINNKFGTTMVIPASIKKRQMEEIE